MRVAEGGAWPRVEGKERKYEDRVLSDDEDRQCHKNLLERTVWIERAQK